VLSSSPFGCSYVGGSQHQLFGDETMRPLWKHQRSWDLWIFIANKPTISYDMLWYLFPSPVHVNVPSRFLWHPPSSECYSLFKVELLKAVPQMNTIIHLNTDFDWRQMTSN
jgi:hypothetical protein